MKSITPKFKENIKLFGRQLDLVITYEENGVIETLKSDDIYSVSPIFNTNIIKSAMRELSLDCCYQIPKNTVINVKLGVLINENNFEFEYINYGNYIVYDNPYNADTKSYQHTCYDKMLYSMRDYEDMNITYPISIKNYINKITSYLGLSFNNKNSEFANHDKVIENELYLGLGYTFRDVLDELAQVTASTICINDNDELEIRYITETNDVVDEDYLKNVNVQFGEKYGPVNSIVLSRSADSDSIYLQDEQSIEQNGLCEIKIRDNQIMNWNDRSDYLSDILNKLNGLEYYINDYSSTGICYYDICDRYTVKIDDKLYLCVMFNDEVHITQGLEENIFTELPEQSETDYTKSDITDRRLNQVYIIVDKQNKNIEAVVSEVNDQTEKISKSIQTVDEISQTINVKYDFLGEKDGKNILFCDDSLEYDAIKFSASGNTPELIYPGEDLFPSEDLFLRIIE